MPRSTTPPANSRNFARIMAPASGKSAVAQEVAHFLRKHERMAALMPAAQRIVDLQKDCTLLLPAMFRDCAVLRFEAGELLLSLPHTALATRLRQQLPQLQLALQKRGWQVNSIQMKVQVRSTTPVTVHCKEVFLPDTALNSLEALHQQLEDTPRNAALKAALDAMLKRHRNSK